MILKLTIKIGKGGKTRKRGKNFQVGEKRELMIKEEGEEYAQVLRLHGQGRVEANCFDGNKRTCTIRGKLRNRVWINAGDIIMVSLREFGDDKGDVVHKYYPEEAFELQELGEIPDNIHINEGLPEDDNEGMDGNDLELGGGSDDEDNKNDDLDIDNL